MSDQPIVFLTRVMENGWGAEVVAAVGVQPSGRRIVVSHDGWGAHPSTARNARASGETGREEELSMWRQARPEDFEEIVSMSLALYREDPGPAPVEAGQVRETLAVFERQPGRGRAVVAEVAGRVAGYALLVPFWSNEQGGEICEVDELYVCPDGRGEGLGSALFGAIDAGRFGSFAGTALGVTPGNAAARRLYERLGFRAAGTTMLRRRAGRGAAGTP